MNDEKLIQLYFDRDERAVKETSEKYGKLCRKISYDILKNEEDCEECLNSSYLKVWNCIPPTRPESFSAFLTKIVRNTALTLSRKLGKHKTDYIYDELEEVLSGKDLESIVDDRNITAIINSFLDRQKKRNRDIFVARYYFNMSTREIAMNFDMTDTAVRSRLTRTREQLKKYLEERGVSI
jgi:RNA polymerase sigma-70 factor (ECF subfamily)